MKITLINTSDLIGGAAIACHRLLEAHLESGLDVQCLVQERINHSNKKVIEYSSNSLQKNYTFYLEKLAFLPYESSKEVRFSFSTALFGKNIVKHPIVQDADILHFHWINKGFLSIKSIQKLLQLNKPIVWTLHDMWAFTGGCHYSDTCLNYRNACGSCFFLRNPQPKDLSNTIWDKKRQLYTQANIHFVTCSNWLKEIAQTSSLLKNASIHSIPNPIDTTLYYPIKKSNPSSAKYTILFQAMNLADTRKGLKYFIESLKIIKSNYSKFSQRIKLLVFGKGKTDIFENLGFEIENLGLLTTQEAIITAYQKADVFVIPSLQDNLPNTVMESLACGVPVVGFKTGGIPEMVNHQRNGYIVAQKDVKDLARGIKWVLEDRNRFEQLKKNARNKVEQTYAYTIISEKYRELYENLLKINESSKNTYTTI